MGPLTLLAAGRKQQSMLYAHTHTNTIIHTLNEECSECMHAHHSSPSAPAQVHPGNIAHTAAWRSRRHLSTDGKQKQLNSVARGITTESNIKINCPVNTRSLQVLIIAFKLAQAASPSSVPVMRLVPLVVQEGFVWRNSTRSVSWEIRRCSSGKVGESGARK